MNKINSLNTTDLAEKLPEDFCADPANAWTFPKAFYTSAQVYEHEKEQIFAKSWICVAHGSELANSNDYITRKVIDENIVIIRGKDQILRAFYNVCHIADMSY